MRAITMVYSALREWALQGSNLRPSDYESVRGPAESNTQLAFQSKAPRQTATILDRIRQRVATPRATHFREVPDPYSRSLILLAQSLRSLINSKNHAPASQPITGVAKQMTATKEWRTADKASWGDGEWQSEPDKVQWVDEASGLDCLAVRGPHGGWCGYVGVAEGHPAFGKGYDDVDAQVHGGLTFADKCADNSRELWERWREQMKNGESEARCYPRGDAAERQRTLGHLRDDYDAWLIHHEATAICHVALPGRPEHVWWLGFDCAHSGDFSPKYATRFSYGDRGDVYRTLDYVREECAQLAAQLTA